MRHFKRDLFLYSYPRAQPHYKSRVLLHMRSPGLLVLWGDVQKASLVLLARGVRLNCVAHSVDQISWARYFYHNSQQKWVNTRVQDSKPGLSGKAKLPILPKEKKEEFSPTTLLSFYCSPTVLSVLLEHSSIPVLKQLGPPCTVEARIARRL